MVVEEEVVGCLHKKQAHWMAQQAAAGEAAAVGLPGCRPSDDSFQARGLCDACATRHRDSWRRTWFRSWGCAPAVDASGRPQEGSRVVTGIGQP